MEAEAGGKDGRFLLGAPTFENIGNEKVRCVETGHELPVKDAEAYGKTRGCRIGLIDDAIAKKKPPLKTFKPDPLSKSKLICKLTGYTINKTEEHIWRHITGKRFLNKLEQMEAGKMPTEPAKNAKNVHKKGKNSSNSGDTRNGQKKDILKNDSMEAKPASSAGDSKKGQKKDITKNDFREAEPASDDDDDNEELDFWIPPVSERWDFDDGKDRWNSCTSSGSKTEEDSEVVDDGADSADLSTRAKRMSIAVGPSSFASRKKKPRTTHHPKDDPKAQPR